MKHVLLALAAILYAVVWGQNWTWYAGALMLAAIHRDFLFTRARDAPRQS